jgi:hypothetical protein
MTLGISRQSSRKREPKTRRVPEHRLERPLDVFVVRTMVEIVVADQPKQTLLVELGFILL